MTPAYQLPPAPRRNGKPAPPAPAAPPGLVGLTPDSFYPEAAVVAALGLGRRTLEKEVRAGRLARPHFRDRTRHWYGRELTAWFDSWPREAPNNFAPPPPGE